MKVYSATENRLTRARTFWLHLKDVHDDLTDMDRVDLNASKHYFRKSSPVLEALTYLSISVVAIPYTLFMELSGNRR